MKNRTENKCPVCGGSFFGRIDMEKKSVCLSRDKTGNYCTGSIPARREEDKLIPVYQEGEWC